METIRRRLLTGRFPVCIDDETLWRPENLHALIATQEKHVVVPLGITEKLIKRRAFDIPGGEDQTAVERHPGFLQAQLLLRQHLAMHALALYWRANKIAVGAESPAVINTFMDRGVTAISQRYTHTPVRADVQSDMNFTVLVTGNDHGIGSHVTHHAIVGLRNL